MSPEYTYHPRVTDILPAPFAWIDIPSGEVTIAGYERSYVKEATLFNVASFVIAKYPITNAQYIKFIEAGGYRNERWWTEDGWQWQQRIRQGYRNDVISRASKDPVGGTSWYEATAFCRWLREATGENVSLLTEQQWQRAAQGDDGRLYPWGNEWESRYCNSSGEFGETIRVDKYEGKGDSPYGVVDMVGNLSEWCLTDMETGNQDEDQDADNRIVRGGFWSFGHHYKYFQVTDRSWDPVGSRAIHLGFRIALIDKN